MMLSDANFFDLKEEQIKLFKQIYGQDQRPNASILQQLVEATGLNIKIVRAWFQNERRKERKRLMEERRRQEKERKRQQKKQCSQKTPKEQHSSSSDLTESDSTVTSGDCSSSSSNPFDSSDADDNKNIKKPIITTNEEINKIVEKSVCSTSQQQQTKQKPQQYKKNSCWCIDWFILGICFVGFLAIIFVYFFAFTEAERPPYLEQEHQSNNKLCGTHNSSLLLSAALNGYLLNEKQKAAIKPQSFKERFKADYINNERDNGTKVIGTTINFGQMDLKVLPIKTKIQLDPINLLQLVETTNLSLQQTSDFFGINWRLRAFKPFNCKNLFVIVVEVNKLENALEFTTQLNFVLTKNCSTTKQAFTIINYTRSDCQPLNKNYFSFGIMFADLRERVFNENVDFCDNKNTLISIWVNLEINNLKSLEGLLQFL